MSDKFGCLFIVCVCIHVSREGLFGELIIDVRPRVGTFTRMMQRINIDFQNRGDRLSVLVHYDNLLCPSHCNNVLATVIFTILFDFK